MNMPENLKAEWLEHCLRLAGRQADLWANSRKILRGRKLPFYALDDSLQLDDVHYTPSKLKQLTRDYLNEESRRAAVEQWDMRRKRAKPGSVSFHTYNHLLKGNGSLSEIVAKKSRVGSIVPPCMQSVIISWLWKDRAAIDVCFRSVELLKKLPADLVFLRDVLIAPFNLHGMSFSVTCYCANITIHPRDWVVLLPHLQDPLEIMETLRRKDPKFHEQVVKWTADYLLPERGSSIANYDTGQRVKRHALASIRGRTRQSLQDYLRDNLR